MLSRSNVVSDPLSAAEPGPSETQILLLEAEFMEQGEVFFTGAGSSSVGRAIAYETRGQWFDSQLLRATCGGSSSNMFCPTAVSQEDQYSINLLLILLLKNEQDLIMSEYNTYFYCDNASY